MKRCPKCNRTYPDDNQKFCTLMAVCWFLRNRVSIQTRPFFQRRISRTTRRSSSG